MLPESHPRIAGRDIVVAWSAFSVAALAVFAWAACCVLPLALSIAGLSLAGAAVIAGQRTWLTLATVIVLGAGWWMVWRRRKACRLDAACPAPSRLMTGLLSAATILNGLALAWRPLIEPPLLSLLRTARG